MKHVNGAVISYSSHAHELLESVCNTSSLVMLGHSTLLLCTLFSAHTYI